MVFALEPPVEATALPSALAVESVLPFAESVSAPVAPDDAGGSGGGVIVTAPPAASERFVVAVAECSARVKPSEKPMALSGALDAPVAFDETAADCVAVMPIAPVAVSVPPGCVPIV